MNVTIEKSHLFGTVKAPPSKSMAHRLLICASLSSGISRISGISDSDDITSTLNCLEALGATYTKENDTVTINGINIKKSNPARALDCHESGSTLRFFIPLCLLNKSEKCLTGSPSLFSRPLSVYEKICKEQKINFQKDDTSVTLSGVLKPGSYKVEGNISSQFISGLLFALPLLEGDSKIQIIPPIESEPYLYLTLDALKTFGINAEFIDERTIGISGGGCYHAKDVAVEGDYSNSAFFDALNLFGNNVNVTGLNKDSLQGDKAYIELFDLLKKGTPTIHIGNCPDLAPIIMAVASALNGVVLCGTHRLRIKESNRGEAMAEELRKFGTSVRVEDDSIVVYPADFRKPTEILNSHNDHRIAMALSTLALLTGGTIRGAEAVNKSLPEYFEMIKSLGGKVKETI